MLTAPMDDSIFKEDDLLPGVLSLIIQESGKRNDHLFYGYRGHEIVRMTKKNRKET